MPSIPTIAINYESFSDDNESNVIVNHKSTIIQKLKHILDEEDQTFFLTNFYLEYNPEAKFLIELNSIWEWLGYKTEDHCKKVIIDNFIADEDYDLTVWGPEGETVDISVYCFKQLCLMSHTQKGHIIRMYYMNLELILSSLSMEKLQKYDINISSNVSPPIEFESVMTLRGTGDIKCVVCRRTANREKFLINGRPCIRCADCKHEQELEDQLN